MARLLVLGEDCTDCDPWVGHLQRAGHDARIERGAEQGVAAARTGRFDLVVVDHSCKDQAVIGLLRALHGTPAAGRVLVITVTGNVETAVEAMKLGAVDYVRAPGGHDECVNVIARALARVGELPNESEPTSYAAMRWGGVVAALLRAPHDVRTLEEWGCEVSISPGTLRNWCRAARLSPRKSLLLGRVLRAVHIASGRPWHPERLLNVTDPRTLDKLLALGGLSRSAHTVSLDDVFARQRLIQDSNAMHALSRVVMHSSPRRPETSRSGDGRRTV